MVEEELKKEILRQRFEQGRTLKSLAEEYGLSYNTVAGWSRQYKKKPLQIKRRQRDLL